MASTASPADPVAGAAANTPGQVSSIAGIGLSPEAAAAAAAAATAAVDGAAPAAPTPPAPLDSAKGSGRQRKRLQQLESKLQVYMDHEDRRVKELTEGVLYELLPAVLNAMLPSCEDPLTELDPERCRAAAGAALAASALMNAPPGFLEFLLCIPWRRLPQLYPSTAVGKAASATAGTWASQAQQQQQAQQQTGQQQDPQQELLAESAADEAERRLLVNMPLHPQLVRPVLLFMYKPQHEASVPPVLRPDKRKQPAAKPPQQQPQQSQTGQQQAAGVQQQQQQPGSGSLECTADDTLMAVAEALLDGATPLHCAALRGNPAQVDHLLFCGADPTRKTAVGDLPLQLVPRCGGYSKATHSCTCLGPAEQEVWECRSRIARTLIASKCLTAFRVGVMQYLSLLWLCLLAFLGLNLGAKAAMVRLLAHMQRREEQQAEEARARTTAAVEAMRQEAHLGQAHLTLAKQQIGSSHLAQQQHSSSAGGAADRSSSSSGGGGGSTISAASAGTGALVGGGVAVDAAGGPYGQLGYERAADVGPPAAAPRPVATAAAAAGHQAGAEAGAGGGQEPVAPGTPSASEEAAAAYTAAAKGRKGAAGSSLRWSASGVEPGQELAGLQSAGSSSSGSSSTSLSHQADDSRGADGQGSSRNSESPLGFAGAADEAGRREHAHRQQLLQELLSAANTSAADASPTVAAAAALAADAEHAWHDPADSLPLTEQAQTVFSEVAFKCFVRAVHALQRLNLQEDCTPLAVCRADKGAPAAAAGAAAAAGSCADSGVAAAVGSVAPPPAGVTAAVNAKLKAAAAASGVAGPLPRGLAAAMTLDAVGSTPRGTAAATAAAGGDAAAGSFSPAAAAAGGMQQHGLQPGEQQQQLCVLEDEQANLYCCWAESVLLKHNSCACAGCTALAVHAIRMAHIAVVRLFNKVHKQRVHCPLRWRAVGRALSRIVYVHIALMCRTEAPTSPSKASVWRAQQCLSEWDQLVAAGLAGGADQKEAAAALTVGFTVEGMVELLRLWAKTGESDILIAEALLGSRLSSLTTLDEALAAAFVTPVPPIRSVLLGASCSAAAMPGGSSTSCLPVLVRAVSTALLNELQSARGLAVCPSPVVKQLAAQVADVTAAELSAGARLRELLAGRIPPSTSEGMAALAAGIAAAEPFSSLAADVETARELYAQSCARAEVATQLQDVVDKVSRLTSRVAVTVTAGSSGSSVAAGGGSSAGRGSGSGGGRESDAAGDEALGLPLQGFSVSDWQQYVSMLEAAVEPAKDANVSVTKARKLIKELQAQLAAADAAAVLTSCMSRRPCGSNALKSAIAKAEAAAPAVSGTATTTTGGSMASGSSAGGAAGGAGNVTAAGGSAAASSSCVFNELLVVRLLAAKKRLEVERAAEVLHKAAVTYKNVADLPKLETAVLNARKLGAEELAPDEYKAASELRARLTAALRVKQQLEGALKGLASMSVGTGPRGRQLEQLAEPVEAAIKEAARCEELLPGEAARATELLEAWRTSSACEAKLSRALRDGCSAATLSRLITEAAAAGVKVTSAKRILKLQQALEAAVATAIESAASAAAGAGHGQLVARLEAAETGGVAPAVLLPARQLLRKLLAVEARQAVEAALKPHSDWSVNTRISTLRAALDKAEEALGCSMQELEEQQDRQPGGDVPQQQDQQQKGGADAAAADAVQHGSNQQQQRRSSASAACSTSAAGSTGSKVGPQQQQQQQPPTRPDSLAGSESCSEASSLAPSSTAGGGSTAGDVQAAGSSGGRPAVVGGGEPEVMTALQELSLRAWQLLQQDQQQLEERERERLEQERARRERERKERQRAAAERAERGKAERETAAQERRAARAKAAAERAKAFTVVFGTSAGGTSLGSSAGGGGGSGAAGAAGGSRGVASKREASRQSIDSAAGAGQIDAEHAGGRQVAPAGDADAAGTDAGSVSAAAARASPAKRANAWGKQPMQQQQQQQQAASTAGKASKSRGTASPAAAAAAKSAAAPSEADLAAAAAGAEGVAVHPLDVAVAAAHARCDSYDILGDEHSKLGLDMLALLESPEDAGPSSTTAAQQAAALLRPSGSLDAPVSGVLPLPAMQQGAVAGEVHAAEAPTAAAAGAASQQGGAGSHPATPKFNLVDLGGASWGVDAAEGLVQPLKQRPASAGGCIMSLSPASAAAARATAAMDATARQSLDLQLQQPGGVGSGQANIWRSPLGLGIDNPSMLPPLAPRGQQLRHGGGHAVTDEGSGGALHGALGQGGHQQQHQQLQLLQGANSFDPVTSPAGRISPVGCAVSTLGPVQVPAPAFMYRQGMGLSSPRSYPQLQHAHPSLLQHQLAAHSSAGSATLLPSFEEGCVTQTAVAISSMCGSSEPLWLLQQQAQLQQQQRLGTPTTPGLLGGPALAQGGTASCFSTLSQPALAASDALQLHFEQLQFEQQQQHLQQQYQQHQDGGDLISAAGGVSAALLQPSLSVPLAGPVSSGLAHCPSPGPLVSQGGAAGGVGALSSSFAFGAPYSSSFSPAPMRGSSSLGGAAAAAAAAGEGLASRCPSGGLLSHQGSQSCVVGGGGMAGVGGSSGAAASSGEGVGGAVQGAGNGVSRPELLLPDDLNFSPPSSSPARWMQ